MAWPDIDRGHKLCGLALAALVTALFPSVLLRGEVFFERDVLIVFVPQAEAFVRAIQAAAWPLWNPTVGFGTPLLANANTQVFYPFTWLNLLLRPLTLYTFYVLAHLIFTGFGFHVWARRVGLSAPAATFGACVWVGSGPLLSLVNTWHHFAGAAWLPWVLWASDRALAGRRAPSILGLAVVLTMQIYAGSPDLCVFTGLVLGADALRRVGFRQPQMRPLLRLVGAYAVAVALGAAQLVPSMDLALQSERHALSAAARTTWSLHPLSLVQTLLPISFKELPRLAPATAQPLFDLWAPFLTSTYLGLAAAVLVAWAFVSIAWRRSVFFAFLFAASVAVALGRHSVVYECLVVVTPPLQMVRYPSKAIIVAALAWTMLASLGYDAWRHGRTRWRPAVGIAVSATMLSLGGALVATGTGAAFFPGTIHLPGGPTWTEIISLARANVILAAVAAAVVALLCSRGKAPTGWTARLVPLIIVAELAVNNRQVNATTSPGLLNRPPEILQSIPLNPPGRVYVWDYVLRVPGRGHPTEGMLGLFMELYTHPDPSAQNLALQAYLYPPSAGRWGLRGSYDRELLGLSPPWLREMNLLLRSVEDTPGYIHLLQLGGVDRVVALHRDVPALPLRAEVAGIFRRPIQIFDVPDPWPRTYVVCQARTVPGTAALQTLLAADFDANREVTVNQEISLAEGCRSGVSRIMDDRADRVTLDVVLDGPGVVVLLDGAASGWQVFVDGTRDQILRVNHIFRGAKLNQGRHEVTFVYRPASVLWGLAISAVSALGLAIALYRSRRRLLDSPDNSH